MSQLRVKGQEVKVVWTGPEGLEEGIDAIQNFRATFENEVLTENYLGRVTSDYDDIFNGVDISMDIHLHSPEYMRFAQRVLDRAQRRDPASGQFNVMVSLEFPTGERHRVVIQDVKFGEIPLNAGGRAEYVSSTIQGKSSSYRFLF